MATANDGKPVIAKCELDHLADVFAQEMMIGLTPDGITSEELKAKFRDDYHDFMEKRYEIRYTIP